jgi:hypothetical protein
MGSKGGFGRRVFGRSAGGKMARRVALVASLVTLLFLGVTSLASAASFYWYGASPDCWQTGPNPGSPGMACDYPGGGVTSNAITGDLNTTQSGDYCNVYNASSTVCNNENSKWPLSFKSTSACAGGSPACGIQHYVSFASQADYPWAPWAGSPALVVSDILNVTKVVSPSSGWAYVCPILQAPGATKLYLEYCFDRWQGAKVQSNLPEPPFAAQGYGLDASCANVTVGGVGGAVDTFVSPYAYNKPTPYALTTSGSSNTIMGGTTGERGFQIEVTAGEVANAIARDNLPTNGTGSPGPGYGCARGLPTDVSSYRLVGIEDGMEGVASTQLSATVSSLSARTDYTPVPPVATTGPASGVTQTQITLNGTVNPWGSDTHYHFEYGTTAGYGSSTASGDAGSGASVVAESATVPGLQPGTTYHYRLVASNEGGTGYGADEVFTTLPAYRPAAIVHSGNQDVFATSTNGAVEDLSHTSLWSLSEFGNLGGVVAKGSSSVVMDHSGTEDVFFTGTNGQIYEERLVGGVWSLTNLGGSVTAAGNPSAVVLNEGAVEVFFRATNNNIYVFWASSGSGPWTLVNIGGQAAGDPTGVVYTANNTVNVYFVGTNGQLWAMWATNGVAPFGLGQASTAPAGGAPATGTVSEVEQTNGGHSVWYRSALGVIWEAWWNPANAQWTYSQVGGEAAGEPSGVLRSNGWEDVYYRGTDATIYQLEIQPGVGVTNTKLGTQTATGDPVAVIDASGYKDVYFPGTNNTTLGWLQGSGGWSLGLITPTVSPATSRPAAVVHSNGSQDVFFTGTAGGVGDLNHGSLWSLSEVGIGGANAQGSESAVIDKSGTEDVFFRGASGQIYEGRLVSGVWTVTGLGNTVAAAGSPSAVVLNEGAIEVFYRATNKDIYVLWASSGAGPWTLVSAGGEAAGDPTASVYTANNTVNVYFVGTNGQLWAMWATNGVAPFGLGQASVAPSGGAPATGTVSEVEQTTGGHSVWYRSTQGVVWEAWWNPANAQWTYSQVGGEAAGEPSGVLRSNGWEDLYYRGTDATIHQLEIQPGVGVTNTKLGTQTATGDPVAVLETSGYRDVYFPGTNGMSAWFQGSGGWSFANLGIGNGLI